MFNLLITLLCIIIDEYIKRLLSAKNFMVSDVVGAEPCRGGQGGF